MFPRRIILEDFTGKKLSYLKLMIGASVLADTWRTHLAEERVGVLLPNVAGMPVTLLSLWKLGKTPAILNYTVGPAILRKCVEVASLKTIITSRQFIQRAKLDLNDLQAAGARLIYLDEISQSIPATQKLSATLSTVLAKPVCSRPVSPESTAVVLFTSGSEGVPKAVELSHTSLLANSRQMIGVTDLQDSDRLFNSLPLFHSFGLSVGTLLPLLRGMFIFLYPSPLHYRVVPNAFYDRNCTVLLATNTFLNGYGRKAHPYDFRSLRYLFAGAEKLQEATANHWARTFGVRILEGYGATECSPCISVNTPLRPKYGTAGRLLPGVEARLEPVPGVDQGGRLWVRGPNIMKGYLNPEANARFLSGGGWYDTGDIVEFDREGFLMIRGRLKRFAKVSGEMVSLTAVEDALAGAFPEYGLRCQVAVVSKPDPDKGEVLIAVSNEPRLRVDQLRDVLRLKGFSNLAVPKAVEFVREIPKLGTGKINHRELEKMMTETQNQPPTTS
jgi:acyl-[acyl-carrier-protein]-phospholipid O-acyltransferase/long-chain-fatty-acid--[acyl-carrier-protein] ligase